MQTYAHKKNAYIKTHTYTRARAHAHTSYYITLHSNVRIKTCRPINRYVFFFFLGVHIHKANRIYLQTCTNDILHITCFILILAGTETYKQVAAYGLLLVADGWVKLAGDVQVPDKRIIYFGFDQYKLSSTLPSVYQKSILIYKHALLTIDNWLVRYPY